MAQIPPQLLGPLRPVETARLIAAVDAECIERAADDVVANAGEILDAATAHEHDRVLLQVVALARDVRPDLTTIAQAHARYLAQSRVGLLGSHRLDAQAHA